jgi:transmembrane sensor
MSSGHCSIAARTWIWNAMNNIENDPTYLAAADWFVRLQSTEVSLEETLEWQTWLHASPLNAQVFARIEEVSQAMRDVPAPGPVASPALASDHYDGSVALRDWQRPLAMKSTWPWPAFGLAASLAVAILGFAFWKPTAEESSFTTAIGENRTVTLQDGSVIALGGDTRIEVSLSEHIRAIELTRGEALFKVAKDAERPFRVRAGEATITAVGTEFNVERDSDRAIVSVTEGRVVVKPIVGLLPVALLKEFKPKLRTVGLNAGQQTTAGSAGIEEPTKMEDPANGWQIGHLAFRLQPLRYVLEDVNRYAHKPIVLDNEGMGTLIITGTVERENIGGWIKSLEHAFDLQATEEAEQIVLRAR